MGNPNEVMAKKLLDLKEPIGQLIESALGHDKFEFLLFIDDGTDSRSGIYSVVCGCPECMYHMGVMGSYAALQVPAVKHTCSYADDPEVERDRVINATKDDLIKN